MTVAWGDIEPFLVGGWRRHFAVALIVAAVFSLRCRLEQKYASTRASVAHLSGESLTCQTVWRYRSLSAVARGHHGQPLVRSCSFSVWSRRARSMSMERAGPFGSALGT